MKRQKFKKNRFKFLKKILVILFVFFLTFLPLVPDFMTAIGKWRRGYAPPQEMENIRTVAILVATGKQDENKCLNPIRTSSYSITEDTYYISYTSFSNPKEGAFIYIVCPPKRSSYHIYFVEESGRIFYTDISHFLNEKRGAIYWHLIDGKYDEESAPLQINWSEKGAKRLPGYPWIEIKPRGMLEKICLWRRHKSEFEGGRYTYPHTRENYFAWKEQDLLFRDLKKQDLKGEDFSYQVLIFADLQETNLNSANLVKADLTGANLKRVDLSLADLQNAYFGGADLSGADLSRATFSATYFFLANLEGADLRETDLNKSYLMMANLKDANLLRSDLSEVTLTGANLQQTNLKEAFLRKACLQKANLFKTNLEAAHLSFASLYRANLEKANLKATNLSRTSLREANLSNTSLVGAYCQGTNFRGVKNLTVEQLSQCVSLENAKGLSKRMLEELRRIKPELVEWWNGEEWDEEKEKYMAE